MKIYRFKDLREVVSEDLSISINKIREKLSSPDSVFGIVNDFLGTGYMLLPSIYNQGGSAVCVKSILGSNTKVFGVVNYLKFYDNGRYWVVVQHHNFFSGIVLPDLDVALVTSSVFLGKPGKLFSDVKSLLSTRDLPKKLNLSGFINGYPRPYHYFYDRLPYAILFNQSFPDVSFFDLDGMDFVSLGSQRFRIDEVNQKSTSNDCLYLLPSRVGKKLSHKHSSKLVNGHLKHNQYPLLPDRDKLVVWIGVCLEKRSWPERDEVIVEIIKYISSCLDVNEVVFIFDGMTSPESDDKDSFREIYCDGEIKSLRNIISSLSVDINYIDVIGGRGLEKINLSRSVDFFFTGALTDSMWPAHFGRAQGISYCSRYANPSLHDHPYTHFIPFDFVKELHDHKNWARMGISISVEDALGEFVDFFHNCFLND